MFACLSSTTHRIVAAGLRGKMNSHVVLIMRSSIFIRSRSRRILNSLLLIYYFLTAGNTASAKGASL